MSEDIDIENDHYIVELNIDADSLACDKCRDAA